MSAETKYKIAVLSDLHVEDGSANKRKSWLSTSTPPDPAENPFDSLYKRIKTDSLSADILLCCGDMAEKANFPGQQLAWRSVHALAEKLGAARVIGTAGNHDLDSRGFQNEFDPKGNLLSLSPEFPGLDRDYSNQYWARNYAIHTIDEVSLRILNINSCAFHGYGKRKIAEFLHGRISEPTLNEIKTEIESKPFSVNIGMFHHHPMKWDDTDQEDYSEMIGGNKLLKLLEKSDSGPWLIIHGHKHVPNIGYAAGGSSSPVIFSSGSFSSQRLPTNASKNEFYLIEIEVNPMKTAKLPIAGTIRAWNWQYKLGWSANKMGCKIPDNTGFGNRTSSENLAQKISDIFRTDNKQWIEWNEILKDIPELRYVLPSDLDKTLRMIEKEAINIHYDNMGWPSQFSVQNQNRGANNE